ncbi:MAG: DUF3794 domain-containing protein [Oscillospiraceae bacterium]|jgi:hypothetical protein|nr:DUF3794 domain-containing protein [Oscillospiraceae bacterium]
MELTVNKETIAINETAYEGNQELPIESDFILPDYCPDVIRILNCGVVPTITSKQSAGDKIIIDGIAAINLIYLTEGGAVFEYETKLPFSRTVALKAPVVNPIVTVNPSADYVNCRALSQRRVDVRGAVSIYVKVLARHEESIITGASGQNVQLRKETVSVSAVCGSADKQFTVREELELSSSKAPIKCIISKICNARTTDVKVMANKVVLKGDLDVNLIYTSEDQGNELFKCAFTLPISQVFEVDGVGEDCRCLVNLCVYDSSIELRPDIDGEGSAIDLEVGIEAAIRAYNSCDIETVCDLYSTNYESSYQAKPLSLNCLSELVSEQYTERNVFDLPEGDIVSVDGLWANAAARGARISDGELTVSSIVKISILVRNTAGGIRYFDRIIDSDFKYKLKSASGNMTADAGVSVRSSDYEINGGGSIEIKIVFDVRASVFSQTRKNIIYDINIDQAAKKSYDNLPALTLYFAGSDESIWDIAKKYNTSVSAILEQNQIEEEVLQDRQMLLIPIVR